MSPAPTSLSTDYLSEDLDFSKTYLQFFKIKDLIEKINIKKFKEFKDSRANGIEGPVEAAETEPEVTNEAAVHAPEDNLQEIDLTEEAIINDEVSANIPALDTYQAPNEETTATPTEAVVIEEAAVTSVPVYVSTEVETVAPTVAPSTVTTAAPATIKAGLPDANEEDALLNEIDTGADKFFISKESVEAAKKYGYKILLKKLNGKEVPVGKIKFSFPTLVEINTIEDDSENVPSETTEGVVEKKIAVDVTKIEETTTAAVENVAETTTALAVQFLPPPIVAVIPTVDDLDENTITEGVKQITEDTEVAIEEIKNQNTVSLFSVFKF